MIKEKYASFLIDILIIFLGIYNYVFPGMISEKITLMFYVELVAFAVINLLEYLIVKTDKEPFYLFMAGLFSALTFLLKGVLKTNVLFGITIILYTVLIIIIKTISLEKIYAKKTHLFLIKLTEMSVLILYGLLISTNMYFSVNSEAFLLGFLIVGYGSLELLYDGVLFLSENTKFLKE